MWWHTVLAQHTARHSFLAVLVHSFVAVLADSQALALMPQAASAHARWAAAHAASPPYWRRPAGRSYPRLMEADTPQDTPSRENLAGPHVGADRLGRPYLADGG